MASDLASWCFRPSVLVAMRRAPLSRCEPMNSHVIHSGHSNTVREAAGSRYRRSPQTSRPPVSPAEGAQARFLVPPADNPGTVRPPPPDPGARRGPARLETHGEDDISHKGLDDPDDQAFRPRRSTRMRTQLEHRDAPLPQRLSA